MIERHLYPCEGEDCPLSYLEEEIERLEAELVAEKRYSKQILRAQIKWFNKHYPHLKDI